MQPLILVLLFYNGSEEEGRANFKPFFELGKIFISILAHLHIFKKKKNFIDHIVDRSKEIPYEELNAPEVCDGSTISDLLATDPPTTLESWFWKGPSSQRLIPH